jgi:hypothetical protein
MHLSLIVFAQLWTVFILLNRSHFFPSVSFSPNSVMHVDASIINSKIYLFSIFLPWMTSVWPTHGQVYKDLPHILSSTQDLRQTPEDHGWFRESEHSRSHHAATRGIVNLRKLEASHQNVYSDSSTVHRETGEVRRSESTCLWPFRLS